MKGLEFDIVLADAVPPGDYPMIIALPEHDVAALARVGEPRV
jgi:hypothetical protein